MLIPLRMLSEFDDNDEYDVSFFRLCPFALIAFSLMHMIDDQVIILTHNEWPSYLYDLELADISGEEEWLGFLKGYFLLQVGLILNI